MLGESTKLEQSFQYFGIVKTSAKPLVKGIKRHADRRENR